jgi:hypothetical protein
MSCKCKRSKEENDLDDLEADWYDGTMFPLVMVRFIKLQKPSIRPSAPVSKYCSFATNGPFFF